MLLNLKQHSPLLSRHRCQRVRPYNITGFANQFVVSVDVSDPQPDAPACKSIEDDTGHHRILSIVQQMLNDLSCLRK